MSAPAAHHSPPGSSTPLAPEWRVYAHLYFPFITTVLLTLFIAQPYEHRLLLLASALPTYFLASLVHHPRPRPPERFTRRSDLHRAAVLFAYGRLLGTPFGLLNYLLDLLASYGVGAVLDRPEGAPPRRSEFLVHVLATAASTVVFGMIPPSWETAWTIMGSVDRVMYRSAWMALVDDVVKVLAYSDLSTKKVKVGVVGLQALIIFVTVLWLHFLFVVRRREIVEREFTSPTDI
ncbi:hypothetical protein BU23DRAFT_561407 [Bimuria novae-zelandiae CBS 107.79]|uniref:Uncharacterized protein n=1 Tax=Bimuria novae-zelandiae CBS 107.79 TaxID=1447943 RepID=A0A6A5UJQ9_9PLEO|nr:hypothetical protein BU23DRAFT_561407 [Bimuria novae-zelandiae CBS 107.79]